MLAGPCSLEGSKRTFVPCPSLSRAYRMFTESCNSNLCLHGHVTPFLCVSLYMSSLFLGHQGYWVNLIHHDFILTWLHLQRPYFQIKWHSGIREIRTSIHLFWGYNSTHNTLPSWKRQYLLTALKSVNTSSNQQNLTLILQVMIVAAFLLVVNTSSYYNKANVYSLLSIRSFTQIISL